MPTTPRGSLNEAFAEVHASGMNDGDIAAALGISRNAVIGMRHRLKLKCNYTTARAERAAKATNATRVYKRREPRASKTFPVVEVVSSITLPEVAVMPSSIVHNQIKTGFAFDDHPIMSLTPFTCRWPSGEPGKDDFSYCLAPKELERVYCDKHTEMAKRDRGER